MIHALVHNGQVEVQEPIPDSWEGQFVKIIPLTPDEPFPNLDERLARLHELGRMEYEPDERERIVAELEELNKLSTAAMDRITGSPQ